MNIRIETYGDWRHDEIQKQYGSILHKFGLTKANDGSTYLNINGLEDLFELDRELTKFSDENDDWSIYFGIMITHNDKEPVLEIKDNYD